MSQTQVVDWRVWKAATIAHDGPPITPGGSPVKAGDVLYVITSTIDSAAGQVDFITPSPVALALNVAVQAALSAAGLRRQVSYDEIAGGRQAKWVEIPHLTSLFDYFQQAMVAAVFSFQSLEAFANLVIADGVKQTLKVKRRAGEVELGADEIQRQVSTEEKLAVVLPQITGVKSPKGTKIWQNFVVLNGVRNTTIHLKGKDQYVRGVTDKQTLYYQFLNHDPREFPRHSIALINYFSGEQPNVWATAALEMLKN
jgi:hypothetical protein